MRRRLAVGIALAALVLPATAAAFDNLEPLAAHQWYLVSDHAWTYWPTQPQLFPINIAVIDSGIDGTHPEFVGRVVAAKSFVGGSPYRDDQGHGTFVAGEIAASPFNNQGIAGMAFNARLMIAKVVRPDGTVSLSGEVAAIRWAVDNGARVINLSLGGVRDPLNPALDTYSPLEQAAVEYAYSRGAVVVAAVGNGPQSPATPWGFAHYPASLPHVIGVSAVRQDGSVPDYSNRDVVYNDLAAPGDGIFSTIPTNLVETRAGCSDEPYSDCGPFEFHDAIGTSFAAPQVSAAAALLLGQDPSLRPEQVSWLLERSADDANASTGCAKCPVGRDMFTGWGTLDVESALRLLAQGQLPPADHYEPNDNAGPWAHALPPLPHTIEATLDYWDDNLDVYRVYLQKGRRLFARVTPAGPGKVQMSVWAPGTQRVDTLDDQRLLLAQSRTVGAQSRVAYRATRTGTYFLELRVGRPTRDPLAYRLSAARS
ncbi:MAG TPA: S8 family serine peptidase [Gaiellaceae bacterium]|nr:S8 family serine peptidase [Gaiellaceae bacterium]